MTSAASNIMIALDRMASGGLTVDDLPADPPGVRVELIEGSLVVAPLGDVNHQAILMRLCARLIATVPEDLEVLPGVNVILGSRTLVIPDIAVVDASRQVHDGLGVGPEGLHLVVEVTSRSTRHHDMSTKRVLYRSWGVSYLIVDRSPGDVVMHVEGVLPDWAQVLLP